MGSEQGGRPHRVVALVHPPQAPFELGCAAEEHYVVADRADDAEGAAWRAGERCG